MRLPFCILNVLGDVLDDGVLRAVPVNREREMAAEGWEVTKSASQIRLAPVTRPLHV
jgi:hypothetical protein